jgi:hypothetical protein
MQRATVATGGDLLRSGLGGVAGQIGCDADERAKRVLGSLDSVKYRVDEFNR